MELEDALAERVLNEVAAGPLAVGGGGGRGTQASSDDRVETPYLQLVMERLWEVERSEGSGTLRAATLARLGGAARIVRDHLDDALGDLERAAREAAASMFDHLVTPSGTKISHGVSDLAQFADASRRSCNPSSTACRSSDPALGRRRRRRSRPPTRSSMTCLPMRCSSGGPAGMRSALPNRARRDAERRRRHAFIVAGIALAGLAVMSVVAIFAIEQRHEAIVPAAPGPRPGAQGEGRGPPRAGARVDRDGSLAARHHPQQSLENALGAARPRADQRGRRRATPARLCGRRSG